MARWICGGDTEAQRLGLNQSEDRDKAEKENPLEFAKTMHSQSLHETPLIPKLGPDGYRRRMRELRGDPLIRAGFMNTGFRLEK